MLWSGSLAFGGAFTNGSLTPTNPAAVDVNGYLLSNSGSDTTSLPGWTISNVDLISTYWEAPPGSSYSVDLNGVSGGILSQTFDVLLNHVYSVTFYYSGNPDTPANGIMLRQGNVAVLDGNGSGGVYITSGGSGGHGIPMSGNLDVTSGVTKSAMNWQQYTLTFQAISSTATLTFRGNLTQSSGIAIGNVSVADLTAVPEPGALIIVGSGLLLIGWRRFRKN